MAGFRDLLPLIPPLVVGATGTAGALSITNPNQSIADCRIMGGHNATYGTQTWVPNTQGNPFVVIYADSGKDKDAATQRKWSDNVVNLFIAIDHATEQANVASDMDDLKNAWVSAAELWVPQNRRLLPGSLNFSTLAGDVRWEYLSWKTIKDQHIKGIPFFGAEIATLLSYNTTVQYQV